ncbi:MAG: hypothetical protein EOP04_04865 [Proteobacteria bacterium]|nr:MAG: hypothetical protein EOP04_04865 [Pseudomonadota bacterium]
MVLNDTCENAAMLFELFDPSVPQDVGLAMACAEIAREKNTLVMAIIEISKNNESPISYYPKRPRLLNVFNSILFVQKDYPSESSEVNQVDFSTVHNAITGISDTILIPGCIGVDFADVKSVVDTNTQGYHFTAHSKGSARGLKAARKTVKKMHQMKRENLEPASALITVSTSECLGIKDVHEVVSYLQENLPQDIDMIFSIIIDESAGEFLRISLYLWNYVT